MRYKSRTFLMKISGVLRFKSGERWIRSREGEVEGKKERSPE